MASVVRDEDATAAPDTEKFRLRRFVERLIQAGEVELRDEPTDLIDIAAVLDGNEKAVLFRRAGPEQAELVGNVNSNRRRLAMALDVAPEDLRTELAKRLGTPQPVVEIDRARAPVQEIVWQGDDADLTRLPVHFQHQLDGAPYISATLDYSVDPATGWTNIGARRLMLRGRRETGIDLVAPSDLKAIYEASAGRGEALAVSFTLGAHPVDHIAASMRVAMDEMELSAQIRGEPMAVVKSITNDVRVPADAEMVLEGYLDERGHVEAEGPFGEFLGYYGVVKQNPVFHLTAITMRRDALFQTATIGGKTMAHTDTSNISALRSEMAVWRALLSAVREPTAVYVNPANGGVFNVRIAMRQRVPGEARNAIAATMGSLGNCKNVFVVDDDIDIYSDQQIDWALATRFQPDRDIVVQSGFRTLPLDPSLQGERTGAKAGYDLTLPLGERPLEFTVPESPVIAGERFASVRAALEHGPKTFANLMAALGSRDGREVVVALDEVRQDGRLTRTETGTYKLADD